jgi:hypothetical protein
MEGITLPAGKNTLFLLGESELATGRPLAQEQPGGR